MGGTLCPPPLNILGLGGVTVSILFGYDLLWNDSPYSKIYMKFGCLERSKIMFDFCDLGLVFVVVLCFRLFRICVFARFVFVLKAVRIAARVVYERAFVDGGDFGFVFFYVLFCFVFCVKAWGCCCGCM